MTDNYDDIIDLPHHVSANHPQMSMHDRAAQFGAFQALTGRDTSTISDPTMTEKPHYNVVAAVIFKDGKFLCTQKEQTRYPYTTLKWEFPGGKIEAGETPQQALQRELLEEMDYRIKVDRHLMTVNHEYPDFSITLATYLCTPISPGFKLKEHNDFRWLPKEDLSTLDWAAADSDIINLLTQ